MSDASARADQLLGLRPVSFFAPHHAYSSRQAARPGRRIPRHGEGPAQGRHRGHSRRRLQPHRRGRRATVPRSPSAASTTPPITCSTPTAAATPISPAAATRSTPTTRSSRRSILDSLRYWVEEMHVDGFRFDLASILARDPTGQPSESAPCCGTSNRDPALAGTKLIAEAWDAAGLYQVGTSVGDTLEGVERPLPRRRPRFSSAAPPAPFAAVADAPARQPRHLRPRARRAPSKASISSPATTASRSTTLSPTTRSTTKPTAKRTATAPTTTAVGTAAPKAPPPRNKKGD